MTIPLSIFSWNVLSQEFAPEIWEKRFPKMCKLIAQSKSDVVCLQEVDEKVYDSDWVPAMKLLGYKSFHFCVKKSEQSNGLSNGCNGCATFSKISTVRACSQTFGDTSQVFLQIELEIPECRETIYIYNVHLKSKHEFHDVRKKQIEFLMDFIGKQNNNNIIVCGDFNARPEEKLHSIMRENLFVPISNTQKATTHKYRRGELVCETIDYIYMRSSRMYDWTTAEYNCDKILPNEECPSDHGYVSVTINVPTSQSQNGS